MDILTNLTHGYVLRIWLIFNINPNITQLLPPLYHDVCYDIGVNKHKCDKQMVKCQKGVKQLVF